MLRKYPLDSIEKPGGTTIWYVLVFDETGAMFVQETHDYDQPNKNDRVSFLSPENFDRDVNGKTLRKLVIEKLGKILPQSN